MRIKMLRSKFASGKSLPAGKEATVSARDGRYLVATGAAELASADPVKKKANKAVDAGDLEKK